MKPKYTALLVGMHLLLVVSQVTAASDWPMFRGPGARSIGQADELPVNWSVADGTNIAWTADLPGRGVSGPIVVGSKVFVTASSGASRNRLHVLAFDAATGEQLWHRQFWAMGKSLCHETSANAAPTPASDGERVFAFFSSNDLIALDLDGNLQWIRALESDYPGAGNALGMASSPVIVDDLVVVQSESQGNSFVAALDCADGSTRWDIQRPKASNWCSPIVIDAEFSPVNQSTLALQSSEGIDLHLAKNGERLFRLETECESIPSLTFNRYLYAPTQGIVVLDTSTTKLTDNDRVVWQESKLQPGAASPVVMEDFVYVISRSGVLTCGSLQTQEIEWKLRLGGRFWATPVLVDNRLYCINSDGMGYVVELPASDAKGKIVAENDFGESISGSPAVADNGLFVRSHAHLWKVAK